MVFGSYQRWLRRLNKDFCKESFLEGDMIVLFYNNIGKTWCKKYLFFLSFFQNSLIFVLDKILYSQGTIPCLDILKIWGIQLIFLKPWLKNSLDISFFFLPLMLVHWFEKENLVGTYSITNMGTNCVWVKMYWYDRNHSINRTTA